MQRFWEPVISELVRILSPRTILEVGAREGFHTRKILGACKYTGTVVHVVDPAPAFDPESLKREFPDCFVFHQRTSLETIPILPPVDLALIDGDHNWYTVLNELRLLHRNRMAEEIPFPFTVLHDTDWPYARRDLYYNPEAIPPEFRQPYRAAGIVPGSEALDDHKGINRRYMNATGEGGPRNGVLTAVEDYLAEYPGNLEVRLLHCMSGLALLFDARFLDQFPSLKEFLERIMADGEQTRLMESVEADRQLWLLKAEDRRYDIEALNAKLRLKNVELQKLKEACARLETLEWEHRGLQGATTLYQYNAIMAQLLTRRDGCVSVVEHLVRHVEILQALSSSMQRSKRWKIGNSAVRAAAPLLRKSTETRPPREIRQTLERFQAWRLEYKAQKGRLVGRDAFIEGNSFADETELNARIQEKRDALGRLTEEIQRLSGDANALQGMVESLELWIHALLESPRYRLGDWVLNQLDRVTARPHPLKERFEFQTLKTCHRHWWSGVKPHLGAPKVLLPEVAGRLSGRGQRVKVSDSTLDAPLSTRGLPAIFWRKPPAAARVIQFTPEKSRNPYYSLLPEFLRSHGWDYGYSTDFDAVESHLADTSVQTIVHLHQLEPLYRSKDGDEAETRRTVEALKSSLTRIKDRGGRLILTQHNPAPHDGRHPEIDEEVTRFALESMDHIIVHGEHARQALLACGASRPVSVIPHPSYSGCYGPTVPKAEARQRLGLDPDAFIFGNLGELKPYKNIEFIMEAFGKLAETPGGARPRLLVVGNPGPSDYVDGLIASAGRDVAIHPVDVKPEEVALWLGAMDFSIFAYRNIWCSGSLILSLSYQVPAIAPELGCIDEYLEHGNTGFLYRHDDAESLAQALRRAMVTPLVPHMRYMCGRFNDTHAIERVAERYAEVYHGLLMRR